jgi:DNA-binding SARP family transcriptional activator
MRIGGEAQVDFRVLGPLGMYAAGLAVEIGGLRQRTVLAMLLLERNRVVPVSRLVTALWGENPPATARGQVQICVSALRRALVGVEPRSPILTVAPGYLMRVAEDRLDLDVFEQLVARGREEATAQRLPEAADHLRSALALWRGPALADITSDVVQSATLRLHDSRLGVLEECLDLELALGRHHELIQELALLVTEHPLRERPRRQQMLALYRSGRKADALAAYQEARRAWIDELGLEPGEELRGLEHAILTDAAELAPSVTAGTVAPIGVPRQLPADVGDFAGRAETVAELRELLRPDVAGARSPRVVILTGQAGVGKSALAVHVAHQVMEAYPDGQLFIDLHTGDGRPLHPSRALARALRGLGIIGSAIPEAFDERLELYRSLLAERRALILLDGADREAQVSPLCPGGPGSVVLVTSRRRLAAVLGARLVEIEVLDSSAAIDLLATITGPGRVAVDLVATRKLAAICSGLPLALRIAGSRLASRPHWTVSDLVERLEDERRRLDELVHGELGIRLSISVTYEALSDQARRLFRLLGILNVAEFPPWVGAPLLNLDHQRAAETMEQLVDARLVEASTKGSGPSPRFQLHDLLRVYARERLAVEETTTERAEALRRLVGCLLHLVEQAHQREYGGDYTVLHGLGPRWRLSSGAVPGLMSAPLEWLDRERAMLVAAVRQAALADCADLAWDLAMSLVTLFEHGAYFEDWRETHETALSAAEAARDRQGEAAMRYSLGALAVAEQRPREAANNLELAHRLFVDLNHLHGQGLCLRHLAFLDRQSGRLAHATSRYTAALQALRAVGDRIAEAHVLNGLSQIAVDRREYDEARRLLDRALATCRTVGSRRMAAQCMHRLGEISLLQGDHDGAFEIFDGALRQVVDARDLVGESYLRHGLSICAHRRGDLAAAEAQVAAGLAVAGRIGERMAEGRLLLARAEIHIATARPTSAATSLADALSRFRSLDALMWQARALDLLGELHRRNGDGGSAVEAWRNAVALLRDVEVGAAAPLVETLTRRLHQVPVDGTPG